MLAAWITFWVAVSVGEKCRSDRDAGNLRVPAACCVTGS